MRGKQIKPKKTLAEKRQYFRDYYRKNFKKVQAYARLYYQMPGVKERNSKRRKELYDASKNLNIFEKRSKIMEKYSR